MLDNEWKEAVWRMFLVRRIRNHVKYLCIVNTLSAQLSLLRMTSKSYITKTIHLFECIRSHDVGGEILRCHDPSGLRENFDSKY